MSLKKWLERNKIYFETLGPVSLGAVGIAIALVANQLAHDQARFQETMVRLQSPPAVGLKDGESAGRTTKNEYVTRYYVTNNGGPLLDFEAEAIVFSELVYGLGTDSDCVLQIQIKNPDIKFTYSGNTSGEIAELYLGFASLVEAEHRYATAMTKGSQTASAWFRVLLQLSFEDNSGRRRKEHFLIMKELKFERTTAAEWEEASRRHESLIKSGLSVELAKELDNPFGDLWTRIGEDGRNAHCRSVGYPGSWRWKAVRTK